MSTAKKILGLDLGTNSIGWALLSEQEDQYEITKIGVRIFSQVTEADGKTIKNAARREKRLARRTNERRVRRQSHLLHTLIEGKLLPAFIGDIDPRISFQEQYWSQPQLSYLERRNPLELRASATKQKLELFEIGRALYHLGQKRGFKSTAKGETKEDTDFKLKIGRLRDDIKENTLENTLGEYFLDLSKNNISTRNLGTDRSMYQDEFEKIWNIQSAHHHDILTPGFKKILQDIIFTQRPLKSQDDLIGHCKYFPKEKKVAKSHPLAQEFIILGYLTNLTHTNASYETYSIREHFGERLSEKILSGVALFRSREKVSKKDLAKWLEITDERWINTGKTSWTGDMIHKKLTEIFGDEYESWDLKKQNGIIEALKLEDREIAHHGGEFTTKKGKVIKVLGYADWMVGEQYWEQLDRIGPNTIPSKYIELGKTALERFVSEMRLGKSYKTIEKELQSQGILPAEYHNKYKNHINLRRAKYRADMDIHELKKLHSNHLPDIRNPRVTKALVELRKLLRALSQTYGPIDTVRIETSRDLKNGTKLRREIEKKQNDNAKRNEAYQAEMHEMFPSRNTDIHSDDAVKYRLWKELGVDHVSPYHHRGRPDENIIIGSHNLYNQDAIQIEHILPFSRSLDDSHINKTLCPRDINLDKGNRTPYEYYNGPFSDDWKAFERRVWNLYSYTPKGEKEKRLSGKGRRLLMTPEEVNKKISQFTSQDLNDTSYIALEAKELCQALMGESRGKQQLVQTSKGQLTSVLRYHWHWNELLNPHTTDPLAKNIKNRGDHRHHAIDAVIIALSDASLLQKASLIAQQVEAGHQKIEHLHAVWGKTISGIDWLRDELSRQLDTLHISHASNHKVRGALHKETNYGLRSISGQATVTTRKRMSDIIDSLIQTKGDESKIQKICENIIDPLIRADLIERAKNQILVSDYQHPVTQATIKGVRIHDTSLTPDGLLPFGKGLYKNDDNHHIEILECTSGKNTGKRVGLVIQLSEAYERKARGYEYIYNRTGPWIDRNDDTQYSTDEYRYLFSLTKGDLVEWEDGEIYQFTGVTNIKQMTFYHQLSSDKSINQFKIQPRPNTLKARKIQVDLLGTIYPAND